MKDYTEKNIEKALKKALKVVWLKKIYDGVPSDACKEYYKLEFWMNMYDKDGEVDSDEYRMVRDGIFDEFDVDDWKYLLKNSGNSPFAVMCRKKIQELEGSQ